MPVDLIDSDCFQRFGTAPAYFRGVRSLLASETHGQTTPPRLGQNHINEMFNKETHPMKTLCQLWNDEAGFVASTELVLIATILVLGMIVGLHTVRNAVVQELGDVAMAIGAVNQSYSYAGATGHSSSTAGSFWADATDYCDKINDDPNTEPDCISVRVNAVSENGGP
jgi:Flp pilus assembly pilin Flp